MTTEDEFQAMIDAHPDDHHTRLVLADWLQERGDPRAGGYRALGVLGLYPFQLGSLGITVLAWRVFYRAGYVGGLRRSFPHALPDKWFAALDSAAPCFFPGAGDPCGWTDDRRVIEDAAALAFAKLPAAHRAELLATEVPA